jgi:hypothetical protein
MTSKGGSFHDESERPTEAAGALEISKGHPRVWSVGSLEVKGEPETAGDSGEIRTRGSQRPDDSQGLRNLYGTSTQRFQGEIASARRLQPPGTSRLNKVRAAIAPRKLSACFLSNWWEPQAVMLPDYCADRFRLVTPLDHFDA